MAFRGFLRDILVLFLGFFIIKSWLLEEGINGSIIITLTLLIGLTLLFLLERFIK